MKNQSTNGISIVVPDELKRFITISSVSKKPVYIYTEEDLGEGLLEMGL